MQQLFHTQPKSDAEIALDAQLDQLDDADLQRRFKSATSWFYMIAGLSLVNSVVAMFGGSFRFIFGLGLTSVADAVIVQSGSIGKTIAFVFSLLIAGLFVIAGYLSRKHLHWIYIVGMVLYLLDGLLSLAIGDYLGAGFHAFALFMLFAGLPVSKRLAERHTKQTEATPIEPEAVRAGLHISGRSNDASGK